MSGRAESSLAYLALLEEQRLIAEFVMWANVFIAGSPATHDAFRTFDSETAGVLRKEWGRSAFQVEPQSFGRTAAGILVSRSADNFHGYLSEALLRVFLVRPETLRSSAKVEVREVLECSSIEEFATRMAERRIDELAYAGFPAIRKFLANRLGVEAEYDRTDLELASEAIAIRNVIVHNRGRVNERFLRDTRLEDLNIGDLVPLDVQDAITMTRAVQAVAKSIDNGLIAKFGIGAFLH